ncbi:DeoR family transcriptional regulator [Bradyrhizobium sp. USDA 4451]
MWQEERRRHIQSMLTTFGTPSVDRLTEDFGVSRETIRRDLMEMEESGGLRRVCGGVVPVAEDKGGGSLPSAHCRTYPQEKSDCQSGRRNGRGRLDDLSRREARQPPSPNVQLRWKAFLPSPTL